MEKIKQKNKTIFPSLDEMYQDKLNETLNYFKKYTDLILSAKILHHDKKPSFYYYCSVFRNSTSNPFNENILFGFEFIDGEPPYTKILTDFINPSLNDNRNYYKCLTNGLNCIFSLNCLNNLQSILELLIQGIENFLQLIYESVKINTFIFFGEYKVGYIYQINDFLQTKNYLNFYRINEIVNNSFEEKFILFTKLYFLLFEPLENDKTLVKLLFYQKLINLDLTLEQKEKNNSLLLKITSINLQNDINLEFILINRKMTKKNCGNINNKNNIKNNDIMDIKEEKSNNSNMIKEWFEYLKNIDFTKYETVINEYKIIFSERKKNINQDNNYAEEEYNKVIQFYENLIKYYEKINNKNNKQRIEKFKYGIIYVCSELMNIYEKEPKKKSANLLKMNSILKQCK